MKKYDLKYIAFDNSTGSSVQCFYYDLTYKESSTLIYFLKHKNVAGYEKIIYYDCNNISYDISKKEDLKLLLEYLKEFRMER